MVGISRRLLLACALAAAASGERVVRQHAAAPHGVHRRRLRSAALLLGASGARAQVSLHEADSNRDGVIDREEFLISARDWMDSYGEKDVWYRQDVYQSLRDLYDVCDMDEDGVLNDREMHYGVLVVGEAWFVSRHGGGMPKDWVGVVIEESRAMHERLDRNSDFAIDRVEFDYVCRATLGGWGWDPLVFDAVDSPFPKQMDEMFAKVDIDGDGVLSSTELHYATFLLNEFAITEVARIIAGDMDADSDGRITRAEVVDAVARHRRSGDAGLTSAQALLDGFEEADTNVDGSLDFDELASFTAHLMGG